MNKKLLILLLLLVMPGLVYCPPKRESKAAGSGDRDRVEEEEGERADGGGNGGKMVPVCVPWGQVVSRDDGVGAGLPLLNPLVARAMEGLMRGLDGYPELRKMAALTLHGVHADGRTHGRFEAMREHIDDLTAVRSDFDKLRGRIQEGFEAQTRDVAVLCTRVNGVVEGAAVRAFADEERGRELERIVAALRAIEDALGLVRGSGEGEVAYRARIARMRLILAGNYVSQEVYDREVVRLQQDVARLKNPNGFLFLMDILTSFSLRYGRFSEVREASPPQLLVAFAVLEAVRRWGPKGLSMIFPPLALVKFPCKVYAVALETVVAAALCANAGGYAAGAVTVPFQGARRLFGALRRRGGGGDAAGQV